MIEGGQDKRRVDRSLIPSTVYGGGGGGGGNDDGGSGDNSGDGAEHELRKH